MDILIGITILLVYQLVGESMVLLLEWPVPGPVVGMLLLFLTLLAKGRIGAQLLSTANGLLSHLSLLFVPAGVGVLVHIDMIADEWLPILTALILSTLVTLALTALVMKWIHHFTSQEGKTHGRR
ncbi:MAG: CidA/LrgA family protein [Chromatiaceae bacterium]|nr:CidA/LrgA family protein [Chromatiaceae bacterium]MCP5444250.1 CidA/LrgA family protein [Chromatiaceae bacterium]